MTNSFTYNAEDIFQNIDGDDENVLMNIPPEISEKIDLSPGDTIRIFKGDQGTVIIEKVKYNNDGNIIPSDLSLK